MDSSRSPFGGKALRRVLAAGIGGLAALVALELTSRTLTGWPAPAEWLRFDAELGHRMRPWTEVHAADDRGLFADRSNSEGFRSIPLPDSEPTDERPRLLVLGDSFVRAYEIRDGERFSEVAVELSGTDWELHHVCSDDWSTGQQLLALRTYGRRIAPERVVLTLYPGNDVTTNHEVFAGLDPGNPSDVFRPYVVPGEDEDEIRFAHPWRAALRARSSLFAFVESRLVRSGHWEQFPGLQERRPDCEWSVREQFLLPPADTSAWDAAWARTELLVERVQEECAALGAELCVVVIPSIVQVERTGLVVAPELARILETRPSPYDRSDFELPERRLAAFFERTGIPWIQTLDALRELARTTNDVTYLANGHINAAGHATVGGLLARWLQDEPVPSHAPTTVGPVDLLPPPPAAPTWLDFTAGPQLRFICGGFGARRAPGWLGCDDRLLEVVRDSFGFVIRPSDEPLRISGVAGEPGDYPFRFTFQAFGRDLGSVTVERPGPFDLRIEHPFADLAGKIPTEKMPYVYVHVLCSQVNRAPLGLAGIGFVTGRS